MSNRRRIARFHRHKQGGYWQEGRKIYLVVRFPVRARGISSLGHSFYLTEPYLTMPHILGANEHWMYDSRQHQLQMKPQNTHQGPGDEHLADMRRVKDLERALLLAFRREPNT